MRIASHHIKGTAEHRFSAALGTEVEYAPVCAWPDDCLVQWGNGIVPANPFFEAFPAAGGFIRGDADTLEEAERAAFAKYDREIACGKHFWSRWHAKRGIYLNGGAHCRKCGCFHGSVFREVVILGHWRKPLKRWERDHLLSMETDHEMNAHMDRVYPQRRAERRKLQRIMRLRLNLFGVDEESSRIGMFA